MNQKKAMAEIIQHFDWERVHQCMKAMNWVWGDGRVPDIPRMKETVRGLFKDTFAHLKDGKNEIDDNDHGGDDSWYVSTGGFRVTLQDRKRLELAFIVSDWEYPTE